MFLLILDIFADAHGVEGDFVHQLALLYRFKKLFFLFNFQKIALSVPKKLIYGSSALIFFSEKKTERVVLRLKL